MFSGHPATYCYVSFHSTFLFVVICTNFSSSWSLISLLQTQNINQYMCLVISKASDIFSSYWALPAEVCQNRLPLISSKFHTDCNSCWWCFQIIYLKEASQITPSLQDGWNNILFFTHTAINKGHLEFKIFPPYFIISTPSICHIHFSMFFLSVQPLCPEHEYEIDSPLSSKQSSSSISKLDFNNVKPLVTGTLVILKIYKEHNKLIAQSRHKT